MCHDAQEACGVGGVEQGEVESEGVVIIIFIIIIIIITRSCRHIPTMTKSHDGNMSEMKWWYIRLAGGRCTVIMCYYIENTYFSFKLLANIKYRVVNIAKVST